MMGLVAHGPEIAHGFPFVHGSQQMADQLGAALRWPAAFVTWWLEELAGLIPQALRPLSARKKSCLILALHNDEIVLFEQKARRDKREIDRFDAQNRDHGPNETDRQQRAAASLTKRRYRKWPLVVRLAGHLGLRKQVDLPPAAKQDLAQLLHFELDRLTPFKVDDVHFAWRVDEIDNKAGRMRVVLEMAPRAAIDRAIAIAEQCGRKVDRVELEGGNGTDEPLDLLPRNEQNKLSGSWLNRALCLTTFILLVIAIVLPIKKQKGIIRGLESDIASMRVEAEESLALRQRLEAVSNEVGFLAKVDGNRTVMTELLAELTRLLPDQSHLRQLRMTKTSIKLIGLADEPADLVAILDQSPLLSAPTFSAPVTREPQSSKAKFQISVLLPGSDS